MGFYYFNVLSIFPLGIAYGFLLLLFWGIARLTRGVPGRKALLGIVGAVFFVLPVAEELWIAWNFGQACKEAGTFIYKKVQVEGFYDSTMRSAYENTKPGGYQFVEHATADRKGIERVERADDEARAQALAWYAEKNPGQELPKNKSVIYPVSDREQIVVFPNGVEAWRVTRLEHPTARYHYRTPRAHIAVSHKLTVIEKVVTDTQNNEPIARQLIYARKAPWYFVSLDAPVKLCGDDLKGLLYDEVLKPRPSSEKGGQQ
ncbi:MAG TPA: hypothetical protein VNK67_02480 [Burkholderiales bacterium]|nr:hypothetical protein [Burkholderiales bacterium]